MLRTKEFHLDKRRLRFWCQHDIGGNLTVFPGLRHCDHPGVTYLGVPVQHIFEFTQLNPIAAPLDHTILPPDIEKADIFDGTHEVTRIVPTLALACQKTSGTLFGTMPIPLEYGWAS